jgi:hypothetical protein
VRLTLRPAGAVARRLLRGHAKLRLRVAVTVTDPQGRVGRKAKTVSVRR